MHSIEYFMRTRSDKKLIVLFFRLSVWILISEHQFDIIERCKPLQIYVTDYAASIHRKYRNRFEVFQMYNNKRRKNRSSFGL